MIDWSRIKYSPGAEYGILHISDEEVRRLWDEPAPDARFFSRLKPRKAKLIYAPPLEIVIAGNGDTCDTAHFPVAEKAVLGLRDLAQEAEEYLKAFIDPTLINNSTGETCVQSIEFGTWKGAEAGQFDMTLTMNRDNYGLWTVRFYEFIPHYFARTQT